MFELLAQSGGQGIIEGYRGETNPILLFIIFGVCFAIFVSIVVYVISRILRKLKFKRLIEDDSFEKKERALFKSYVDRLRIYDPVPIFLERAFFDNFIDSISHLHEASQVPFQSSLDESVLFSSMRKKLGFSHDFGSKKIIMNTRSLPVGYPISLTWSVSATKVMQSYYTTVKENTEFFIAVASPEDIKNSEAVVDGAKTEFDVCFARKGDAQYFFFSHLIRIVTHPQPMWLISHSQDLSRAAMMSPLGIPAVLMFTNNAGTENEEIGEYEVSLGTVNNQGCLFLEEPGKKIDLSLREVVIVNFTIEEKEFSCRSLISNILEINKGRLFQVSFSQIDEEDRQFLINYRLKQKTESLKKQEKAKK